MGCYDQAPQIRRGTHLSSVSFADGQVVAPHGRLPISGAAPSPHLKMNYETVEMFCCSHEGTSSGLRARFVQSVDLGTGSRSANNVRGTFSLVVRSNIVTVCLISFIAPHFGDGNPSPTEFSRALRQQIKDKAWTRPGFHVLLIHTFLQN